MDKINPGSLELRMMTTHGAEAKRILGSVLEWYMDEIESHANEKKIHPLVTGLGTWLRVNHRVVIEDRSILDALFAVLEEENEESEQQEEAQK